MPETITSRQNPSVIFAASLLTKKGREENGAFPAEGEKLFLEAVNAGVEILRVYIREEDSGRLLPVVREKLGEGALSDGRVIILSDGAFGKISSEKAPQGIITIIKSLDFLENYITIDKKDILSFGDVPMMALCSVRDPGNLGAILRSAGAFGVTRLLISSDCADLTSPKTVRAAMGALFRVRVATVENFGSLPVALHAAGRRLLCAELKEKAVSLPEVKLMPSDVVMIGNEGHGIPREISELADGSVYLPIRPGTESLNAAVAASIFLWELTK